jgi:hypothetical protein
VLVRVSRTLVVLSTYDAGIDPVEITATGRPMAAGSRDYGTDTEPGTTNLCAVLPSSRGKGNPESLVLNWRMLSSEKTCHPEDQLRISFTE